jgi:hypothetical protein
MIPQRVRDRDWNSYVKKLGACPSNRIFLDEGQAS